MLEENGFHVELPSNADWGYVFRLKTNGIPVVISVISLPDYRFGIAVEVAKGVLGFQIEKKSAEAVEFGKNALNKIAPELSCLHDLKWYSNEQWRSSFGAGFWKSPN